MTATGTRRGNLIYHWKHGWIPLDHFAALSKAHHSKTGAVKVMQKHGIDVPKGYRSDHKVTPEHSHPTGAWVRATQPGISHETHGKVVGHTDSGMLRVQYQDRLGKSQVGTFNPAHTTVVAQEAGKRHTSAGANFRAEQQKAATARQYSDAEIKRGYDLHGKAIGQSATPEARVHVDHSGDGTILHFGREDTQAREAAKSVGARWSRNLGAWYLPRNQTESTRRFKVSQLQTKLGHENVHLADTGHGKTTTAAEREAARKAASGARAERLDARAAKHEAEAEARYKAAKDIMDRIPLGQPILVGHHSERGARADQKRIHNHSDKMVEAMGKAKADQRAAEAARHNATNADGPLKRQRRIDKNEAEIRAIDRKLTEHSIATKAPDAAAKVGIRPMSADYHAKLTAQRAELADQVAHDKAQIEASGFQGVNPANVKPGDMVQYRGRTHIVTKVNKTTFNVPTPYSWEDKVPINQATKHIPLASQSDDAVRNAYDKTTNPKVKAAFAAELKRRGLLT